MASNTRLSDKGLVRQAYKITVDGVVYLLKNAQRQKPVVSQFERGEFGLPLASMHVADFEKITGEIMVYAGVADPSQNYPFLFDGKYWAITNLTLTAATENLRNYSVEITMLAGTQASDFTTTT